MLEVKYFLLVSLILLVIFSLWKAAKKKEFFNPFLLFSAPILVSHCINLAIYDPKYSILDDTYVLYFLSVLVFCFGLYLGTHCKAYAKNKTEINNSGSLLLVFLWLLMFVCSAFALYQIYKGYTSGIYGTGWSNFMGNIRYYTAYVSGNNFLAKYGIVLADFFVLYYLYRRYVGKEKTKKNLLCVITSVVFYLIFTATEFNKTNILYLFSVLLFFFILGNIKHLKRILFVGVLMLVLFIFALNKVSEMTGKGLIEGEHWAFFYFGSEFRWLDLFAFRNSFHTDGYMSLGIFGRILASLNIISLDGYNAYREVAMSNQSPVSSFVLGPYLDFGYGGLVILLIYGFLIGWIYQQHKRIGGFWTIIYATCIYQLVISFFAFQFGLSSQIYVAILFLLVSWASPKKKKTISPLMLGVRNGN